MTNGEKAELEEVKKNIGVENPELVTDEQFEKIQQSLAEGKISKENMILLMEAMPHYVQLSQTYIDGLRAIANSAVESQKSASDGLSGSQKGALDGLSQSQKVALDGISKNLESYKNVIDALNNVTNKAETEELRSKIADILFKVIESQEKITKILQDTNKANNDTAEYINKDNNDTWKYTNKDNNYTWKHIVSGVATLAVFTIGVIKMIR